MRPDRNDQQAGKTGGKTSRGTGYAGQQAGYGYRTLDAETITYGATGQKKNGTAQRNDTPDSAQLDEAQVQFLGYLLK
jgi:hypothetical protein